MDSTIQLASPADAEDLAFIATRVAKHPILSAVSTNFTDTASVALARVRATTPKPRISSVLNDMASEILFERF